MFKYTNALTNRSGDALPGYFARLYDSGGNLVSIYADANETPISTVSGVANAALSDENGMFRWYVANGAYDIVFSDANNQFVSREIGVPMFEASGVYDDLSASTGAALVGATSGTVQASLNARPTSAALAASGGAALVGFIQSGTGAVARTTQAKARETFSVKDFGAAGDGTTDDTPAIILAGNAIQANGGGRLVFPKGEYLIYKQGVAYGQDALVFTGLTGVVVDASEAVIKVDPAKVWATSASFVKFVDCNDVQVNIAHATSPAIPLDGSFFGMEVVSLRGNCVGVDIPYLRATNCLAGVLASDPTTTAGSRNIRIGTLVAASCVYGINLANSGSNVVVENEITDGCGRSLFFYGVSHIKARVKSRNFKFSADVGMAAINTGYNSITGIDIDYTNTDSTSVNGGIGVQLGHSFGGGVAGTITDVRVRLNVAIAGGMGSAFEYSKIDASGNPDTTDRGHVLRNLRLSGQVSGSPATGAQIQLGRNGSTFSTGETIAEIDLSNLVLSGFAGAIDAKRIMPALKGGMFLRDITSAGDIDLWGGADVQTYSPTSTSARIVVSGIECPNLDVYNGVSGVHSVRRPSLTTSPVTMRTAFRGLAITNAGSGGTVIYNLPVSLPGLEFEYIQISGNAMRIDPNGTELFRNQTAGKYLQLDSGNGGTSVTIRCVAAGAWDIIRSNGTTSFEP